MISARMLAKYLKEVVSPVYYIAVVVPGVDDDNIRLEEFAGY
ncbi:MAG: hypothetical protein WCF26_23755 [Candidatus Sulfotelmatobacter sp.]